jgi:hypothetical protein
VARKFNYLKEEKKNSKNLKKVGEEKNICIVVNIKMKGRNPSFSRVDYEEISFFGTMV